jgi:hypothetical protein
MRHVIILLISLLSTVNILAQNKSSLIFSDDFNRSEKNDLLEELGKNWVTNSKNRAQGIKQADLKNNQLHIKMAKTANHGVSIRHDAPFKNGIVEVKFKITDKKGIAFNFNDPAIKKTVWAGHVCQIKVTPSLIKIVDQKEGVFKLTIHSKRKAGVDKKELQKLLKGKSKNFQRNTAINKWHQIKIKFEDDLITVWIDNEEIGKHKSIGYANLKQNIAFAVSGEAAVDDLKIVATE